MLLHLNKQLDKLKTALTPYTTVLLTSVSAFLVILQLALFYRIKVPDFLMGSMPLFDFDIYWQMARDVLQGMHPYQLPYMQTSGPPLVIAPFFIFSFVPLVSARAVMSMSTILCVAVSSWLLTIRVSKNINQRILAFLLLQFFFWLAFPTRFTLLLGQLNAVLLVLITLLAVYPHKQKLSGILVALSLVVKTNYIFLLFTQVRNLRKLLTSVLTVLILIVITSGWLKPVYYTDYLTQKAEGYVASPQVNTTTDYYNQSLRSTLTRVGLGNAFQIIWVTLLVILLYQLIKTQDLELGVLTSLLVSPIIWSHYVVVIYPFIVIRLLAWWKKKDKIPLWKWVVLAILTVLLTIEVKSLHQAPLTLTTGILASHYYIGLALLYVLKVSESSVVKKI